jgi:hypothetical protein
MTSASLIPDRLRNHFPLNGGRRPTERQCYEGHKGIEAARAVLEETTPLPLTGRPVVVPLTVEQTVRARKGLDTARHVLNDDVLYTEGRKVPLN